MTEQATTSPTTRLADFTAGIDTRALPEQVRQLVVQHVLEILAGMFAGADIPEAASILRLAGDDDPAMAGKAAMLAHAAESDPIHAATTLCAGLTAIPLALLFSPDGATAVAATVAGYEAAIRIGEALGSSRLLGRGWWPTAVLGGAGAAAATARALRLDGPQTRNAISLALVQAGGLGAGAPEAPESRNLLAAHCVRTGVAAAQAAARGISGPAEPLVGDRGFLSAFGIEPAPERLLAGLGDSWKITETWLKTHPCALQAQSALDALRGLMTTEGLSAGDIEQVAFALPDAMRRIVDRPGAPATHFAAAASLQFLAAALMIDGDVRPERMAPGAVGRQEIVASMEKISVTRAPDLESLYPAMWPARVRLTTASGVYDAEVRTPPGHPDRPRPLEGTLDRFRAYSASRLDHATQDALTAAVIGLAELTDMSKITRPLRTLI